MMEQRTSRYALIIPGVLLIIFGIAVLIEPRILAWFAGIALIVMGSAILMITRFIRGDARAASRYRDDST
jgi:uncharacterized membrane protein HdeD (DUF308 family)